MVECILVKQNKISGYEKIRYFIIRIDKFLINFDKCNYKKIG